MFTFTLVDNNDSWFFEIFEMFSGDNDSTTTLQHNASSTLKMML